MTTETSAPTSAPAELDADHGATPVRQRRPGRGGLLLGVLLALCGAMAVVAAGLILRGVGATAAAPRPAAAPRAAAPQPGSPSAAQPTPADRSAASAPTASAPAPTASAPALTVPPTAPTGTVTATTVTVLNNSRITGLANQSAAVLRDGGWAVAGVGNYTGRVPVTTVFFADGRESAAHALADAFPSVQRVLPRLDDLPDGGLIVVVTSDFAR